MGSGRSNNSPNGEPLRCDSQSSWVGRSGVYSGVIMQHYGYYSLLACCIACYLISFLFVSLERGVVSFFLFYSSLLCFIVVLLYATLSLRHNVKHSILDNFFRFFFWCDSVHTLFRFVNVYRFYVHIIYSFFPSQISCTVVTCCNVVSFVTLNFNNYCLKGYILLKYLFYQCAVVC